MIRSRPPGFTLIEVLVAVAIVAVLALAIGIGLSGLGGDRQLEREAERFKAHLDFACESAMLDGRSLGVRLDGESYAFLQRQADHWVPVEGQPALARYRLPAGVQLIVRRDGMVVTKADKKHEMIKPQLACLSSGELTPFTAELTRSGASQRYQVTGHADARIELSHVDIDH